MWIKRDCSSKWSVVLLTMWPWPLTLKLVGIVARGVGNLPTNFGVSIDVSFSTYRPTPVKCVTYLATFTFDLGSYGACRWYGSSCSVCVPSLNFVGLPVRKLLGIYCVSINPPGDLDLWPLNPKIVPLLGSLRSFPIHRVWTLWVHSFLAKRTLGLAICYGKSVCRLSVV